MQVLIELKGMKRKELAQTIGKILDVQVVYKGPPGYIYEVGWVKVERDGNLFVPEDADQKALEHLVIALREYGFGVDWALEPKPEPPYSIVIQLPAEGFTAASLKNLQLLIDSKALLIRKALGACDLSIGITEELVYFPWFERELSQEEITAYTHFITLLSDMAKRQSRVLATEKPVENEKYAFRCFLLRLGMIGEQYTESRRILLRDLSGNGSMKSGECRPKKAKVPQGHETEQVPAPIHSTESQPLEPETPQTGKSRFSLKKLFSSLKIMAMD